MNRSNRAGTISMLLIAFSACARSHELDNLDASVEPFDGSIVLDLATADDAGLDDPWLAEPCPSLRPSCLDVERTDSWYPSREATHGANGVAAVVARGPEPFVLFARGVQLEPAVAYSPGVWMLQPFDSDGIATLEQHELTDSYGSQSLGGLRGALAIRDGRVIAANAHERLTMGEPWYVPMQYESSITELGDELLPIGTVEEGEHDVALTPDALVVASADDVALFPLTNLDQRVSLGPEATGKVVAAALPENATVVAWTVGQSVRVVVVENGEVVASEDFLPSPLGGSQPVLTAINGEIWLGRFVVNQTRLRDSRIRVVRLDRSLRRLERDRWFSGWGGLTPQGLAMVESNGSPLLLWTTVDTRYGAHTVLHARLLDEAEVCGADVTAPSLIWGRVLGESGLFAATGDDEVWFVVPQVEDMQSADMYRLTPCDPVP